MLPAAADDACVPAEGFTVVVAGVPEADVLRLADGRQVRLAGIATPRPLPAGQGQGAAPGEGAGQPISNTEDEDEGPDVPADIARGFRGEAPGGPAPLAGEAATHTRLEASRAALAALAEGRSAEVRPVGAAPDRHGRIVAQVRVGGDWLQERLVARGLARVVPAGREATCARPLFAAEAAARRARRGIWVEPSLAVRRADDPGLAEAAGSYVLVEGRVLSTGRAGGRHYLNFGKDFRSDFTAIIEDKEVGRFVKAGFDPARMRGREVRLRGWLTARDGGFLTLSVPEEIEWTQ
ncbi:OB-fold nucleic acid binding domain-containing protein [Prosthecomicrobium sp. N25]|uniref:OB-fold nucleic acid binding domain-containing protein n=1 Tax=Prosthecomicrobium sp. N25 TaxID=3129254 RepID=UPI00307757BE